MRKFDPWPVFFKREFNRNWPFLVGFAITGTIITKFSLSLTEEDRKNSVFAQRHKRYDTLKRLYSSCCGNDASIGTLVYIVSNSNKRSYIAA
ncbi:hypothetical protein OSB04_020832 [Centaurea solstitialis]|uniref:Uncharacterized protein n=1 Tax=Centaurea solstitialis TaxID=347529 RepID=A0AA38SUN5_9ASTR|nr:hypothetical protein OSB04_020832 [Centaurea solstitialis]